MVSLMFLAMIMTAVLIRTRDGGAPTSSVRTVFKGKLLSSELWSTSR